VLLHLSEHGNIQGLYEPSRIFGEEDEGNLVLLALVKDVGGEVAGQVVDEHDLPFVSRQRFAVLEDDLFTCVAE